MEDPLIGLLRDARFWMGLLISIAGVDVDDTSISAKSDAVVLHKVTLAEFLDKIDDAIVREEGSTSC